MAITTIIFNLVISYRQSRVILVLRDPLKRRFRIVVRLEVHRRILLRIAVLIKTAETRGSGRVLCILRFLTSSFNSLFYH